MLKKIALSLSMGLLACQPVTNQPEPSPSVNASSVPNATVSPSSQISPTPSEPAPAPTPMNLPVEIVAGNGERGFQDGTALEASFYHVDGMCTAPISGDIYLTDKNKIRKLTPDGQVITLAGQEKEGFVDGASSEALFNKLYGCTVDDKGNLYVVDQENKSIRKLSSDGQVSTLTGPGSEDLSDEIWDVTWLDNQGLYISEEFYLKRYFNGRFEVLNPNGGATYQTEGLIKDVTIGSLAFMASDRQENIYIADRTMKQLRHFNTKTQQIRAIVDLSLFYSEVPSNWFGPPLGIALDKKYNNIFLSGNPSTLYAGQNKDNFRIIFPSLDFDVPIKFERIEKSITVGLDHKVYIYDYIHRQIKRLSPPLKDVSLW